MHTLSLGIAQLVVATAIAADPGFPFGIPPEPEDGRIASVAPERCLGYVSWSASASPSPTSANELEQLLAEPDVQHFVSEIRRIFSAAIRKEMDDDPRAVRFGGELIKWSERLATQATAAFCSQVEWTENGPDIHAGLVTKVGEHVNELRAWLDQLRRLVPAEIIEEVEIQATPMYRLNLGDKAPQIMLGIKDDYFYASVGEGVLDGMLSRVGQDPPRWLVELREQLPVARRSLVAYLNAKPVMERLGSLPQAAGAAPILEEVGLANLSHLACISGLDSKGHVSRSIIGLDGPPTGLLAAAVQQPLTASDLESIPGDATIAVAARINIEGIGGAIVKILNRVSPDIAGRFSEGVAELEEEFGIRFRDDLLRGLDGVVCVYHSPGEGGWLGGFTAVLGVKDRRRIQRLLRRVRAVARSEEADLRRQAFAGHDINYLNPPDDDVLVTPAWCLTETQLILALYPQTVRAVLSRGDDYQSLATSPEVSALMQTDPRPVKIYYQNTPKLFQLAYPLVQVVAGFATAGLREEGIDIDVAILPTGASIQRHLRPDIVAVRGTGAGIEVNAQESFPGSSGALPLTLLAAIAAESGIDPDDLVDAVSAVLSPARARENNSINNLKQIGLAMHFYHDTYNRFPAAFSTADDGTPLLSWRVHLLPFLDEGELYNRFQLDQPWDSDHNRRLIPQMPAVYRAPGSRAAEGKTNYVTPRGEQTIFPGKNPVRMADITDGTANTVLTLEVTDAAAVTWTKPDDIQIDPMDPLRRLTDSRRDSFLMGLADGSVRRVHRSVERSFLRHALTRNGGEPQNGGND